MRDKFLIIGPIANQGGREIEVNMLASKFSDCFDVEIFSLIKMDMYSQALGSKTIKFSSLPQVVLNRSFLFRILTQLSFFMNNRKGDVLDYVGNSISKKVFALENFKKKLIIEKLAKINIILICADVSSTYIKEIIEFGRLHNKKVFFRTTGTIKNITSEQEIFLSRVHLFLHHSLSNAQRLCSFFSHKYEIIDQAAHNESSLVKLPLKEEKPKIFGYLGRLSPEKGVATLLEAIRVLHKENQFVIAGDGPLGQDVRKFAKEYDNVTVLGWIDNLATKDFFKKIDCLIIPSLEESGPLVAIEAICAANLIVTTRVGAMEERLNYMTKSFFFKAGDSQDLIRVVQEVTNLDVTQVTKLSQEHRTIYTQKFSQKYVLSKYLEVIKKEISVL